MLVTEAMENKYGVNVEVNDWLVVISGDENKVTEIQDVFKMCEAENFVDHEGRLIVKLADLEENGLHFTYGC